MSRKISELAAEAFYSRRNFKLSNTEVRGDSLYLFGNEIARLVGNCLEINLCGWNTLTTRERLNALYGVNLTTKNGQAILNGEKIDSNKWYRID